MNTNAIVIAMLVLAVIVAVLIPMSKTTTANAAANAAASTAEGFQTRAEYIDIGQKKYNDFSDSADALRPNIIGTHNSIRVDAYNSGLRNAMRTSELTETPGEPTYLGVSPDRINAQLAPENTIIKAAKACEAKKGRATCAQLGNNGFAMCGVCIKEGTIHDESNPKKHIGGLLLLPEEAKKMKAVGNAYQPTVGACPAGYFFADKDACEKEVNRLDCKEIGESGGFEKGKTAEELTLGLQKCAQAPAAGESTFVYEPKADGGRKFNIVLRALAPIGTGMTKVAVYGKDNTLLSAEVSTTPGREFTVTVPGMQEQTGIRVVVTQEAPHRPTGKNEVFQYKQSGSDKYPNYNQTKESAKAVCQGLDARQATAEQLRASWQQGAQACSAGWTDTNALFPMQNVRHEKGWCGAPNTVNTYSVEGMAHSWCFGVKPPQSNDMTMGAWVEPFFKPIANGEPSQEGMPEQWSQHGSEYQAPFFRGVLLQWEMADGSRVVPFESTITGINGMGASTNSTDGTRTFKILRRFGTYATSQLVRAPKPNVNSRVLTNQFWIWANQPRAQSVTFDSMIPGIFAKTFYPEDQPIAGNGPLIGNPSTMRLLRTSPCLKAGQAAGKYSVECLASLFAGAGGDLQKGKLATGGLGKLNTMGDMEVIAAYLDGLYTIATTGRDATGMKVGGNDPKARSDKINEAAQLMFGFDITSPCEDVTENAQGDLVIVVKSAPYDAWCLDHLWTNAGNYEFNRGFERNTASQIKGTYTSIFDRYSGLRKYEGTKKQKADAPFQTCRRDGKMAPVDASGNPNMSAINAANMRGSMTNIQNFYDSIHKAANYASDIPEQATGIEQCYGISKSMISAPAGCGVKARYVRVLSTGIFDVNTPDKSCIQIPKIEVFDGNNNELTKGKRIIASDPYNKDFQKEKALDDSTSSMYHSLCVNPRNDYWMVDLGQTHLVTKVKFVYRQGLATRQLAAPIQLLDESRTVVAQKNLGEVNLETGKWGTPEEILFYARDTKSEIPLDASLIDKVVSLSSAISWDRYLRNQSTVMNIVGPDAGRNYSKNAMYGSSFKIVSALNGKPGHVSFQSRNDFGEYIRHAGFRLFMHRIEQSSLFRNDASFRMVPALNGNAAMVSFESANYPGRYISAYPNNPFEAWITTVNTQSPWDVQRASWRVRRPLEELA